MVIRSKPCCRQVRCCSCCRELWILGLTKVLCDIVVFTMLLSQHSAMAAQEGSDGFELVHEDNARQLSEYQIEQEHQQHKKDDESRRSKAIGNGITLKLMHRDARNSPFRDSKLDKSENNVETIFHNLAKRDAFRSQVIESIIARHRDPAFLPSSSRPKRVPVLGPPLESPVISGLDFGSGEYFAVLSFGSPATDVLVTIDTGSDLVWLQCHPCDDCYDQIGPIYNPAFSESYESVACYSHACDVLPHSKCWGVSCLYTENYGDGSFSTGEFATETITLNTTREAPFEIHGFFFGCGHDNEGLFTASAGLLGLGRGHLSFPSQMADVLPPRFSYCLSDRFGKMSDNDPSFLYFGEAEESTGMQYTDLVQNPSAPTFYYLQLQGMSVEGEQLEIPASEWELNLQSGQGGVIIDSGTAVTRLSTVAYTTFRDHFRWKARHLKSVIVPNQDLFDTCFEILQGQIVPIVTLHFSNNVHLDLPMDNIVIPVSDSGSLFCLAFAISQTKDDLTIIGNVQQQGFRIEFDLGNERVGFSAHDCSLPL